MIISNRAMPPFTTLNERHPLWYLFINSGSRQRFVLVQNNRKYNELIQIMLFTIAARPVSFNTVSNKCTTGFKHRSISISVKS